MFVAATHIHTGCRRVFNFDKRRWHQDDPCPTRGVATDTIRRLYYQQWTNLSHYPREGGGAQVLLISEVEGERGTATDLEADVGESDALIVRRNAEHVRPRHQDCGHLCALW